MDILKIPVCETHIERKMGKEEGMEREKEIVYLSFNFSNGPSSGPSWARPKAGVEKSTFVFHLGGRGLSIWDIFCFLPRDIVRKLDQNQINQDSD